MKSNTNVKLLLAAAGLALGVSAPARAQQGAPASSENIQYGQLGSTYVGAFAGYLRPDSPIGPNVAHEYGLEYNQNLASGLDFNLSYDDQQGRWDGGHPRSDEILAGLTGYAPVNTWLRPFASAQGGIDYLQVANYIPSGVWTTHDERFDYVLSAGAEFQVLPALVVTPFAAYQEVHRFSDDWTYGVKATYRIVRNWSVSLTPEIDEHHALGWLAGVDYHF